MAFVRDHGTCCLAVPLKLGAGLVACLMLAHAILGMVAIISDDVRLQPNGYNMNFNKLPSAVNIFGVVFGFIGILGIYDDKHVWVWWMNRYFALKLLAMFITMAADFVALQDCDSWMFSPHHDSNPRMDALSQAKVCPWARWSYVIGCGVDLSIWCYLASRCITYEFQIAVNPPYKIDFGQSEKDALSRWKFYGVGRPSAGAASTTKEDDPIFYGSAGAPVQGDEDTRQVPVELAEIGDEEEGGGGGGGGVFRPAGDGEAHAPDATLGY